MPGSFYYHGWKKRDLIGILKRYFSFERVESSAVAQHLIRNGQHI